MTDENSSSFSPVRTGDVLADKYRVDSVLGVGGMGVVVAVTHLALQERFAVKFMLATALTNQTAVQRFIREARASVRLKSVHAARVVDVGTLESGSPFMVMEYLEGEDVGTLLLRRGRLDVTDSADIVLQACEAVAEAHSLGIVHRDLKPRNLFATTGTDGNRLVKVLDFGISKMRDPGQDLSLTKTTEVMGSPNYMSPEQLRATRDVDERADLWALGIILFELLTGKMPFDAQSVTQLTAMVLLDPAPRLRDLRADVPDAIGLLVARCLEKDPSRRPASVAEIADVLDAFAPEYSRGLSRRVRQVGNASRGQSVPPPSVETVVRVPVSGGTSVSWSQTEPGSPSSPSSPGRPLEATMPAPTALPARGRWPKILLGAGFALAVASGAALFARSRAAVSDPVRPAVSNTSAEAEARPAPATATVGPVDSAVPPATASATPEPAVAVTQPAAQTSASAAARPNRPRPTARPTKHVESNPGDDIPSERH
jgi:serine/threonine-protein kinase